MVKIAIIGGGAAGLLAAGIAGKNGADVTLFERNPITGKKILITGKGRCNVTCTAEVQEMEKSIPRGGKFLRTALYSFPPSEVVNFFEGEGVPLKTERGGRIFPVSDRAEDIRRALTDFALREKNVTLKRECVRAVEKTDGGFLICTDKAKHPFQRVLVATGGLSYPGTGSDGRGYLIAKALGHSVTPCTAGLIPLVTRESLPREAMGLSLKNIAIRVETASGKRVYEDFGEMLFCHFGVSGPVILSASSYLDFTKESSYRLFIDLKPALSREELDKRLLSDFKENCNRDFINSLSRLLPQKLIEPLVSLSGIDPRKKVNLISREERQRFVSLLKSIPLTVTGTRSIKEAIITRGGVSLKEIDPRTMESRITPGLFFAGEVLDADALTGGFNLQIAFSTGRLAGESISKEEL